MTNAENDYMLSSGMALLFEMGCGKSLTSIAIMGALYNTNKISKALIVCPTSIISVWEHEIAKFADFKVSLVLLTGDKHKRLNALQALENDKTQNLKVAIINYESVFRTDIFSALQHFNADIIIADESQRIKNHSALQSKAMHALGDKARYKLILSGTPIQNNLVDIYSQYRFLNSSIFGTNFYVFRNKYCIMNTFSGFPNQVLDYKNVDQFKDKLFSIAYRVTKDECLDLPEQTFLTYSLKFSPKERSVYNQLRKDGIVEIEQALSTSEENLRVIANTITTQILRLRQLTGGFMTPTTSDGTVESIQVNSVKLDALSDILTDYVENGSQKLVIFAVFRAEIHAIEQLLKNRKIKYGIIYGDIQISERGNIVDDFQNNPETKVFLAQAQTAGLGITLTAASTAVFYSVSYNYADYSQMLSRIHRIGQNNKCTYIHLEVEKTIDKIIHKALEKKESNARMIIDNWQEIFKE